MALVLAATLLTLAVVVYVLAPILQDQHAPMESDDALSDARARKRVALMALRDAEYDRATGKLDPDDYAALRDELSTEALAAIRHEERTAAAQTQPAGTEAPEEDRGAASEELELEIARVRAGLDFGTTCTVCAHVNREGSNFCTTCGRPLRRLDRAAGAG